MAEPRIKDQEFLEQITAITEDNLSDEHFGVSELAEKMAMSRSSLLRKVKKTTSLSVSQFIRNIRLKRANKLLKETSLNISEISYQVGFGSTSYFIKCFREEFGYSPGESGKQGKETYKDENGSKSGHTSRSKYYILSFALLALIAGLIYVFIGKQNKGSKVEPLEKSIAVLPFLNNSSDSSNLYLVNGLMESVLLNLQKIEDIRVISRTSVEKYRGVHETAPEMARDLKVNYLVEGSGQKIGDEIVINIQLIDAVNDNPLWSGQYERKVTDIFELQKDISERIASEIRVIITPQEKEQISKKPTESTEAYDHYLRGLDFYHSNKPGSINKAIEEFEKAVEYDEEFAIPYGYLAICYYSLDLNSMDKLYTNKINQLADKAIFYDPEVATSQVAKGMYYMQIREFSKAEPFLLKGMEYSPNSAELVNFMSNFYTAYIPNTEKYLQFALRGIRLNTANQDSITSSYLYLHLSNALIQLGFVDEAIEYINLSLSYYPDNLYSEYVKSFIMLAKTGDLEQGLLDLQLAWKKDTARLDILQDIGKLYYSKRDYESAYRTYQLFKKRTNERKLDIYPAEDIKIAWVYKQVGDLAGADELLEKYHQFLAKEEKSIYTPLLWTSYYAYIGETEKAVEQLRLFSEEENYFYWVLLIKGDPILLQIKDHPDYTEILDKIDQKFWKNHERIKVRLEAEGLI